MWDTGQNNMHLSKFNLFGFIAFLVVVASAAAPAPKLLVAGLGDCEKVTKDGAIPPSPHFWDPVSKRLSLHGGRNEVVAAQLMLTAVGGDIDQVDVKIGDLKGPGIIPADPNITLALEAYQYVEHGDWDGFSQVLPDHKWYPDALIPFRDPYDPSRHPIGTPFAIRTNHGFNQGIWLDVYIPRSAKPGAYTAPIRVEVRGRVEYRAKLVLKVHNFTIPDEYHVDGYGEIYGQAYGFHKASYSPTTVDHWWRIAKRYHQMAHQHRFVVMERWGVGPDERDWDGYDKTYGHELDGSLFTAREGYFGPGENTGVSFWKSIFRQQYDGRVPSFTEQQLEGYASLARQFWEHITSRSWGKRRFFAYIVDEPGRIDPLAADNLRKLAHALDAGAGNGHIALMWTSHTNPALLAENPATDLRGIIRWWAPNGQACDPVFLAPRVRLGETVWFYHHGHPANGVHAVNASGIELRTWGNICWRYKLSGSFWWAVDLSDRSDPMNKPIYNPRESRWGNGVLFYCGARLPDIGFPAIDGPVSSLRMKAYRRGLQDYEYCWLLAQKGKQEFADKKIKEIIPVALTEALPGRSKDSGEASEAMDRGARPRGARRSLQKPPWRTDVESWYRLREELAQALEAK